MLIVISMVIVIFRPALKARTSDRDFHGFRRDDDDRDSDRDGAGST